MDKNELSSRLKKMADGIGRLVNKLPNTITNRIYSNQIVRSCSSAAANYRAACRAKSKQDFIYQLRIVLEELDETQFFIELLGPLNEPLRIELLEFWKESNELIAIFVASINTARTIVPKKS